MRMLFLLLLLRFRVSETTDLNVFLDVRKRVADGLEANLAGIGLSGKPRFRFGLWLRRFDVACAG